MVDFPLLTALILLPVLGAAAVVLVPRTRTELVRPVAITVMTMVAGMSAWMLTQFDMGDAGFQFGSRHPWIADLGVSWHLGIDGISLFLVVLTAVLFPIALLGAAPHHDAKS